MRAVVHRVVQPMPMTAIQPMDLSPSLSTTSRLEKPMAVVMALTAAAASHCSRARIRSWPE